MSAKHHLTPLRAGGVLDDVRCRQLSALGITTVEELAGQLASDPANLRTLLGLTDQDVKRLTIDARAALPDATRERFDSTPGFTEAFGAERPDHIAARAKDL